MDKTMFLDLIFEFFNKADNTSLKQQYSTAFTYSKPLNWAKLYEHILKEVDTRYLPAPKWFISQFPLFEIREHSGEYEGYQIRVTFKSGWWTDYTVCNCEATLGKLINKCKDSDKVLKAEMYDPSVTLIGKTIYPKDAKPKVLYQCA